MTTRLFRSKSCVLGSRPTTTTMFDDDSPPPTQSIYLSHEYEVEEDFNVNPISTPLIDSGEDKQQNQNQNQFPILAILLETLRKSLITCASVERGEDDHQHHHHIMSSSSSSSSSSSPLHINIGWPTEVTHVSHVTFDRFNGFLGLPVEFEPQLPRKVPSASVSVFGVSAESMQCSYDHRGISVPTILLLMQKRLYSEGGLKAEGIFRINAENSQEEYVRDQLNRGLVPYGIDVHCLAGLIKAWFRELPKGVLDSLTPDQVMHCNTEEECSQVVSFLPPMEAALLDWAINLMVDVVQDEHQNKMNARNIAMVFAPNMTQMADPLTALLHAVQVMNFLKTLILKALREREESVAKTGLFSSCSDSQNDNGDLYSSKGNNETTEGRCESTISNSVHDRPNFCRNSPPIKRIGE
ncbi:hypothetical protein AQUCO_01300016v1 [Aquilegia coerulea]|uniref:Rho-GAP domain-containing protein n=1 Tax=Aquilegia coerulea TaxID=218851 RepID=A0A2G5DZ43_AQUCA|nr:hypothetical protein AQUCO_01300016v1 [Aquilegia coerulea]